MLKRTKLCKGLMMACGGVLLSAGPAVAQQTPPAPGQTLERVEITGSSIRRIDAQTALPVQVITREDIARTGAVNVEQLLQSVSSVSSSGSLPTASSSGATTGSISAVGLRGLSSLRTLVLINGRRVSPYGVGFTNDSVSVDVNSIPLAAIERVEILKDGASSIYGSDAIAGVINFILRQDFKGVELTAEYGDTKRGADFKRATGTFGFGNVASDRFNLMGVLSYQKEGSLVGGQRGFASSSFNAENDTTSGNTFPGNIIPVGGTATRNPSAPGCPGPYAVNDPNFPSNRCRFDTAPLVTLIPDSERFSFYGTGKYAITPDIQLYAEASYNQNKVHVNIQPVPLSDQFAIPDNNPLCGHAPYNITGGCVAAILLTPTSPFYPTAYATAQYGGTPNLLVRYRSAITGNRDLTDISEAPRFVAGIKGTAATWDFDVAGLYTESKVRERVNSGYPLYSEIMPLLNSGNVNLFGSNSQSIIDQANAAQFRGDAFQVKQSLTSLTAKASREVWQLPAGAVGFAAGGELRREKYTYNASDAIQTGDVSGYGGNFLPVDRSRNVEAAFAEVNVPIFKTLEGNVSVRFDHYQGVGSTTNPKASLRYQPIPQVLLRTSYGTGFRAPSLLDLYGPQTQGVSNNGLSDPLRCSPPLASPLPGGNNSNDCLTQFSTVNGGNPNLKPEKSKNLTAGLVIEPVRDLSIGFDYFNIELKNQIQNGIDADTILGDLGQFGYLVTRGAPNASQPGAPGPITSISQQNLNIGKIDLSGIDIDATYRMNVGDLGRFTVIGNATYFIKYDAQNIDGTFSGQVDLANSVTGGVIPRLKGYVQVNWSRGPLSVTVGENYQKHYHDIAGNVSGNDRDVAAYLTTDLQASYQAFKSWRFTLGVRNLFDRDPPYTNVGGTGYFQSGYDPTYADPRGRFMYGRVTYAFQ